MPGFQHIEEFVPKFSWLSMSDARQTRADSAGKTSWMAFNVNEGAMSINEGASFDPETIVVLRFALDDAWSRLSDEQRSQLSKSILAERILKAAAKGERNPDRLRRSALIGLVVHEDQLGSRIQA